MKLGANQSYVNDDMRLGHRVELPVWSDQWMMGARFGVVKRVIRTKPLALGHEPVNDILCVQCDNPRIRRQYKNFAPNFRFV